MIGKIRGWGIIKGQGGGIVKLVWYKAVIKETDMKDEELYFNGKISLGQIRNRNERRVVNMLPEVLDEIESFADDPIDVQDVYALALNKLPAHYVQEMAIVLQKAVDDEAVRQAIIEAVQLVQQKPNHA